MYVLSKVVSLLVKIDFLVCGEASSSSITSGSDNNPLSEQGVLLIVGLAINEN